MHKRAKVYCIDTYDVNNLYSILDEEVFFQVRPGDTVILKPNWVLESHKYRPDDWEYVITHPTIVTAVLRRVIDRQNGSGKILIIDGPQTDASFNKLISRYPLDDWYRLAAERGVNLEVVDLREHEWITRNGNVVGRHRLAGDPRGSTEMNIVGEHSEFSGHEKSVRGYYGADYNIKETNCAHDGYNNLYKVSRSIIEADVFINLPKLKTHRKSGITCCLKNLVGINTYKNFLPHHSEGGPIEGGDQFPIDNVNARIEGPLMAFLKQNVMRNPLLARLLSPLNVIGNKVFGDTRQVIRSGNWYGNDTIWRMILDLNKVLLYGNSDGSMRTDHYNSRKRYIGIVDAILAGEGNGPLTPEPINMGYIICGSNPVAIDAVCAVLMGFDPKKIPSIAKAFDVKHYPLCDFTYDEVRIGFDGSEFSLDGLPLEKVVPFEPQFGWKGHIEMERTK